ncbi:Pc16g05480 [Penicillium rubens Wisconsin 54-1255]|uniref:Pc16g05480 protein n=1 Tax=Penicillium rubens (strain ATCC 28089 / DSM 1075 / NRRL 1951 / Wisconsin 54-1255) TaxID=500485 RepID=B6H886_PENRW|nr:Pc16g05480 [Penicillium rubens Wisconsin 54-1255]
MPIETRTRSLELADPALLEKIDKLFACNMGEYVSLPQLVVVGDQSCGKSSVLEALTKINFPRDSGLCTRFATHIIFRRDTNLVLREVSASIIPASDANPEEDQKLRGWKASDLHVLQLEIRGPNESHLSVIDVPGIFNNTTSDRTTKNDIALVRNMVLSYMQNQRSIMLAVVPANADIATQEIIEMASEIDPEEGRTLRILTKPDLVDKGAEHKVIQLIHDGNANGQLGWILVRNLGQKQLQAGNVDRDTEERMLKDSKDLLQSLGAQRETPEQQRRILLDIVSAFQEITRHALAANYGVNCVFDEDKDLRLATLVSLRNDVFSNDLAHWGHTYTFRSKPERPEDTDGSVDDREERRNNPSDTEKQQGTLQSRKNWDTTQNMSVADLEESLHVSEPVEPPFERGILSWIEEVYSNSRGFEIGKFNPTLLSILMRKQSVKWPILARGYISDIISVVHAFIRQALEVVSKNTQISTKIMSLLMDDLVEKYKQAISKVEFLLRIERDGTPLTLNHYFNDNLEKCRQKRMYSTAAKNSIDNCKHGEVVRLSDLAHQHHMSNIEHTVRDIHDILDSYYKVARKRFLDTVCMQAADYCLVTGPEAPMKLFSPSWVNDLSNERLEEIVGEGRALKRRRRQLQKEIEDLEAGKAVLMK